MQARTRISIALVGAAVASTILSAADYTITVSQDRLNNALNEPQNWLLMNGDYGSTRYSKLTQINRDNVKNLRMAWAMALGGMQDVGQNGPENEVNPLIDNGFMYTTDGWGTIYKIDARDGDRGKFVWVADPGVQHEGNAPRTRGIALWQDRVLANLPDGRVIAINRDNGEIVWDKKIAKKNEFGGQERFFTAPIVADGKVLVQNGAGDGGTRGWIAALDVKTGDELWRFYTVPKPGDPGSESWKDDHSAWKTGGGGIWQTGSYDPVQKLYIVGTGNPYPIYDPQFRPGDNLYTNSVIAVNVDTGKLAWYFQYTPGDYHDYDEVGPQLLIDTKINGEDRKVLAHFGRNGIFYDLDRTNGSYIQSGQYVGKLNWTKGLDPKTGKPLEYDPTKSLQTYAIGVINRAGATATTCPNIQGGTNFFPTGYNPTLGIAYAVTIEGCSDLATKTIAPADVHPGQIFQAGTSTNNGVQTGTVTAIDVATGKSLAQQPTPFPMYSGVMTTPDLVWAGSLDGTFAAYDAKTLQVKWSMNVGTAFQGSPIAFNAGGKEYIAVVGGGPGLATFGHPELTSKSTANVVWVFGL